MVPVAVVNELLFPVLAPVDRGLEVPDLGCLAGRAERAERCIHITGLLPDRAVVDPVDQLDSIAPGKRCADRMPRFSRGQTCRMLRAGS